MRVVVELAGTPGAAEGVRHTVMRHLLGCLAGVDVHAAHGVADQAGTGRMVARGVAVVMFVGAHVGISVVGFASTRRGGPPANHRGRRTSAGFITPVS
jgi:hypothetical protein